MSDKGLPRDVDAALQQTLRTRIGELEARLAKLQPTTQRGAAVYLRIGLAWLIETEEAERWWLGMAGKPAEIDRTPHLNMLYRALRALEGEGLLEVDPPPPKPPEVGA